MFADRRDAGRKLARALARHAGTGAVVLALPRGGVEVAFEVAQALRAPLDIIVARKLGAPSQPELALGAVVDGEKPEAVFNEDVIKALGVTREELNEAIARELAEIRRRESAYRQGRAPIPLAGRTAIVIDDGIATGASVRAALRGLRRRSVGRLILAVPVAPPETVRSMRREVDELVCLESPDHFQAVGAHYRDFEQTSDETVIELLGEAQGWAARDGEAPGRSASAA